MVLQFNLQVPPTRKIPPLLPLIPSKNQPKQSFESGKMRSETGTHLAKSLLAEKLS